MYKLYYRPSEIGDRAIVTGCTISAAINLLVNSVEKVRWVAVLSGSDLGFYGRPDNNSKVETTEEARTELKPLKSGSPGLIRQEGSRERWLYGSSIFIDQNTTSYCHFVEALGKHAHTHNKYMSVNFTSPEGYPLIMEPQLHM